MAIKQHLTILLAVGLLYGAVQTVHADSYPRVNVNLAIRYIIPAYQVFAAETARQLAAFEQFCATPNETTLKAARAAFHTALDAWMSIQHIDFGPIEQAFQIQRINHWPERRNAVDKSLNVLIKNQDYAALASDKFTQLSVAVQGFPALERLLFKDTALSQFLPESPSSHYRCVLLIAIGRNLANLAQNLSQEWQKNVLPTLGAGGSIYFPKPIDATRRMMTSLRNLLQTIADLKLERVLDQSLEQAKPRLAENRRSGRSIRNILINLRSARAMYGETDGDIGFNTYVLQADNGPAQNAKLQQAFTDAISAVQAIQKSLDVAVIDPVGRTQAENALVKVEVLRDHFREIVPKAANISLGFTSFGD